MPDALGNTYKEPKFALPLNESGLILVGRIALMWSQVEHFMDEIIGIVHNVPMKRMRLLMGDRLTGQRMQVLNNSLDLFQRSDIRDEAKTLYCNLEKIRTDRNHIMHGLWGWYNPDHEVFEAASLSHKRAHPFMHSDLVKHHDLIAEETHRVIKIYCDLTGLPLGKFPQFFFGPTPPESFGESQSAPQF